MNSGINLIFYIYLGIHKYIYDSVHSYERGQAHPGIPEVFSNIKSSLYQDWIDDMMLIFCIWLGIHRNSKLIQLLKLV